MYVRGRKIIGGTREEKRRFSGGESRGGTGKTK